MDVKTFETDVLIIGGGTAGPMAAIKAKLAHPDTSVTVVEKSTIRRGGSYMRGMDAFNNAVIPGIATPEEYVESKYRLTDGLFDPELHRVMAEGTYEIVKEIEERGLVNFPREKDGSYMVNQFYPTVRCHTEMRGDPKPVFDRILREHRVNIIERTIVTKILTKDGSAIGATMFNYRTGEFMVARAKTVILAAGSQGRFALGRTKHLANVFDCPYNTCSHSLAYHAGAELINMEIFSLSPQLGTFLGPGVSTFLRYDAYIVNSMGERIMEQYDPELLEHAPSYKVYEACWKELQAGRGPVFYDLRHLPEEEIQVIEEGLFESERPTLKKFYEILGIDFRNDLIEIYMYGPKLCAGHGMPGAWVNTKTESTVPGLFIVGDAAAVAVGQTGACWVYGTISGQQAAAYARNVELVEPDTRDIIEEYRRVFAPLNIESSDRLEPEEVEFSIRHDVMEYVASPKNAYRLNIALKNFDKIRQKLPLLYAKDFHGVMKCIEVGEILDSAVIAASASLVREESRLGLGHMRVDFPETSEYWKDRYVAVRKDAVTGKMRLEPKQVPRYDRPEKYVKATGGA